MHQPLRSLDPSSTIASGKSGALFVRRRDDPSNRRDHEVRLVELNVMTTVRGDNLLALT